MHRPKLVSQAEQRGERLPEREGRRRVVVVAGGEGHHHPEGRGLRGRARGRPEGDAGAGRDLERSAAVRLSEASLLLVKLGKFLMGFGSDFDKFILISVSVVNQGKLDEIPLQPES